MEEQFEKCCGLGTSWALEGLRCEKFSGPVSGVPTVEQGLCLEAVDICCVRAYHEQQCKKGKLDAHAGLACVSGSKSKRLGPGDYHRDCCEACKLGKFAYSYNFSKHSVSFYFISNIFFPNSSHTHTKGKDKIEEKNLLKNIIIKY